MEAFEILLLAILSAVLKCEWGLENYQEAMLTSFVFVGFLFGAFLWGFVADMFGRKNALFMVIFLSAAFGYLSAFSPSFGWIVFLRCMLGLSAAGSNQGITFCIEYLPVKTRAITILLVQFFWMAGALGIVTIGWLTVPNLGWRYLVIFAAIPITIMLFIVPFVPPSARFMVIQGRTERALKVINMAARINCKSPLSGQLVTDEEKKTLEEEETKGTPPKGDDKERKNVEKKEEKPPATKSSSSPLIRKDKSEETKDCFVLNLFKNGMWKTTFLLWVIWLMIVGYYYGIILLTTTMFQFDRHCSLGHGLPPLEVCKNLDDEDYKTLLWTTSAEIPGIVFTMILLVVVGRKVVMATELALLVICSCLLFVCANRIVLTIFIFLCRGLATGIFQALFVYTPEVYPTSVRAFGLGASSTVGRFGGIVSPYIAQVLFPVSDYAGIASFVAMAVVAFVCVVLLPIETKGRSLEDTGSS